MTHNCKVRTNYKLYLTFTTKQTGFPGASGKEPSCQSRKHESRVGRIPWRRPRHTYTKQTAHVCARSAALVMSSSFTYFPPSKWSGFNPCPDILAEMYCVVTLCVPLNRNAKWMDIVWRRIEKTGQHMAKIYMCMLSHFSHVRLFAAL